MSKMQFSSFCGLDFGTSNTTIAAVREGQYELIPLEGPKKSMRSAIFCDAEMKEWVFGEAGVHHYLESIPGRLMMSLKSVLGSSLMEDKTLIFDEYISYSTVLGRFIKHIKNIAEHNINKSLTQVVMGRPVYFHDNDPKKDKIAQQTLETITREAGFKDVLFQYEPIAAALTYETSIQKEQLALIVDMGGGTSDFTIIRLHPNIKTADRSKDVLANAGIHIAGTDFDQRLSIHEVMPLLGMGSLVSGVSNDIEMPSMVYYDLTTWHTLSNLYTPNYIAQVKSIQSTAHEKQLLSRLIKVLKQKAGHHILNQVEQCKQKLSDTEKVNLNLDFIETDLSVEILQATLNKVINEDVLKIVHKIQCTVEMACVKAEDINAIFYTGGSSKIPMIRERINALFKNAKIIQGDAFGSVGLGLAIDAARRFS